MLSRQQEGSEAWVFRGAELIAMPRYRQGYDFNDLLKETEMNRAEMEICGQNPRRRCLGCYAPGSCRHRVIGNV